MEAQEHISQLLKKYSAGQCTPEEKAIITQWYESLQLEAPAPGNRDPEQLWGKIAVRTQPPPRARRRTLWVAAAAAAAVIALAVALLYPQQEAAVQQTAAVGKIRQVALPDGSRMWLSAGANVRYETGFAGGRHIELESGEAFFDVVRDDARPFTVNARGTQTLVLGTSFRVSAGEKVEVAVVTGKVKVTMPNRQPVVLLPRETIALGNNTAAPEVKAVPAAPVEKIREAPARQGWQAQRVDLDDVSTGELAQLLESVYSIHIDFDQPHLKDCRNTISLDTGRPLTDILDKLKLINHFDYTITNEGVKIYGAGCGAVK